MLHHCSPGWVTDTDTASLPLPLSPPLFAPATHTNHPTHPKSISTPPVLCLLLHSRLIGYSASPFLHSLGVLPASSYSPLILSLCSLSLFLTQRRLFSRSLLPLPPPTLPAFDSLSCAPLCFLTSVQAGRKRLKTFYSSSLLDTSFYIQYHTFLAWIACKELHWLLFRDYVNLVSFIIQLNGKAFCDSRCSIK